MHNLGHYKSVEFACVARTRARTRPCTSAAPAAPSPSTPRVLPLSRVGAQPFFVRVPSDGRRVSAEVVRPRVAGPLAHHGRRIDGGRASGSLYAVEGLSDRAFDCQVCPSCKDSGDAMCVASLLLLNKKS